MKRRKWLFRKPRDEAPVSMLRAAREWHSLGFNVIPIQNSVLKKPLCESWKQWQHERQTAEELDKMLLELISKETPFNLAVILGTYGGKTRAVIDLDSNAYVAKFEEFFPFLNKQSTILVKPSKGLHIYVYLKEPTETRHLAAKGVKIDLQCEKTYVVVPPSYHATATNRDGTRVRYQYYSAEQDEITTYNGDLWLDLSDFIREKIDKDFVPETQVNIVDELLKPKAEHEGRNAAAIRYACLLLTSLRGDPWRDSKTWRKLLDWNSNHEEPLQEDELRRTYESALKHEYAFKFDRELTRNELEVKQPLTPQIEAFLRAPNLEQRFLDLTKTTIQGEEELRELIYFLGLGAAVTDRPNGLIIISLPGHGKSYVEEQMMKAFPKERVEQPTSVSEQVLNYLQDSYKGMIVRIDEIFGVAEGMETMRVWMSNGRLERWVTDPDTHKPIKLTVDGCPALFTSTIEEVEPQYGSRNWITHVTSDPDATRRIHDLQDEQQAAPRGTLDEEAEAVFKFLREATKWVMQNPVEVVVPFRYKFPYHTGLMRREKPKFDNLVKFITQVYQLQRDNFTFKGTKHVIASEQDFALAKKITSKFFMSTIMVLDEMEMKLLEWARQNSADETFTTKQAAQATRIPYTTTRRRLTNLSNQGYLTE
jgi:hypothetical protein